MKRAVALVAVALAGVVVGAVTTLSVQSPARPGNALSARTLSPVAATSLLVWTPGSLPDGLASQARTVPGVSGVAEVASGVAWLDGWSGRGGSERTGAMHVPVEVAAVDPDTFLAFLPPADDGLLADLAAGRAILGATAASLRSIGAGSALRFGTTTLPVVAVVPDELVGAHEVLVSRATASALGVRQPRYLLVALHAGASAEAVEDGIMRAVPAGTRVRIRAPGETPVFRHGDAVLPPVRLKELFGEFGALPSGGDLVIDEAWIDANIVSSSLPVVGTVRCHRLVVPQLRAAFEEIERRGLAGLVDPSDGGCWSPRFINRESDAGISHHAWGVAIDLNVADNPYGAEPRIDRRIVEVLERWGFAWGGRWLVPDGMHFEFVRFPLSPKG